MESVIPLAYLCGVMPEVSEMVSLAGELRMRANLRYPSFSTRQILDACFPGAIVTGRELPPGVHEIVTMSDRGRPLIVYRRGLSGCDQRFAIAHAIAHLIYDFDSHGRLTAQFGDPAIESRADNFALELLAPASYVAVHLGELPLGDDSLDQNEFLDQVDGIASRFHVPAWAISTQIQRLRD